MKPTELQIGNLVSFDTVPFKVVGINPPYVDLSGNGNRLRQTDIHKEDLKPIPITKDLILKNGFIMGQDYVLGYIFYEKEIDGYYITIKTDCSNISEYNYVCHIDNADRCTIASADILYVHQLQNLLNLMDIKSDITV